MLDPKPQTPNPKPQSQTPFGYVAILREM